MAGKNSSTSSRSYQTMQVKGPSELLEGVIRQGWCIGCGMCVNLCPYFKNYKGKTSMIFNCTRGTGRCYAYCPKIELDLDELGAPSNSPAYQGTALGNYKKVYQSRAGRESENGSFQAGGTVSALMSRALANGLLDAAVLTDREGLVPVARLITDPHDVIKCAGSKYTAAPTLSALNQGIKDGYKQIGVVGTPCQISAIAKMKTNPTEQEAFTDPVALTIGLFCTWALDTRDLIRFISERIDINRVKGMDIPPPPAEVLIVDSGTEKTEFPLSEIRPLIPKGCGICPDMTAEWADISVGVMEGTNNWNTLVVRTVRGAALVEDAIAGGILEVEEMPAENLSHLEWAAHGKKKRALLKAQEEGWLNNETNDRPTALRIDPGVVKRIIES